MGVNASFLTPRIISPNLTQSLMKVYFLDIHKVVKLTLFWTKETLRVEESLNVTFDESPPPSKTSPLVDDDLVESKAIESQEILGNDKEDELLNKEIVNVKESKSHPLDSVIGNINENTKIKSPKWK